MRAGMSSRVIFTGQTENVADYLRVMDIFVLPSYREGFPKSVLEAMSTGLPVVATDIRGSREAVVHGETGLIVPAKDSASLAAAVERLLDNPQLAARMGRAGRQRVLESFNIADVQRRFFEFIEGMIGDQHAADIGAVAH
jgi:glycosyltransferase involved in cell wall biosynthesis